MTEPQTVTVYTDYKSPYAYLAKDLAYELERTFRCGSIGCPTCSTSRAFSARARLDDEGRVVEETRNAHQWRRVRYSYMDCRRQAPQARPGHPRHRRRSGIRRSPLCGMLYAKRQGEAVFRRYHDTVFERFWKRELDIEDAGVICGVLAEAGADTGGFPDYLGRGGPRELDAICRAAEAIGRFRRAELCRRRRTVLGPRAPARNPRDARRHGLAGLRYRGSARNRHR